MDKILANAALPQLCLYASAKYKNRTAFSLLCEEQITRQVTYAQMGSRAKQIASLLRQMGVKKGGRVMLLSDNCPEWPIAYFGIAIAGAVSVPLLTGFSPEQIKNIAEHSGISAICISEKMAEKLDSSKLFSGILSQIPCICIENINYNADINEESEDFDLQTSINDPDELATIIYTSGTQGSSKGVMLSSRNLISSALSSNEFFPIYPSDRLLSVLPLAHSYECGLGFLAPIFSGASITYLDRPPSPSILLPALKLLRPTAMITVPLLMEKIYNNAIGPKLEANKLYKFAPTRLLASWIAGRKLIAAFGGKIRFLGIGGAPLAPQVEKFLHNARFPYSIGYGLTETSPLVAGNTPLKFTFGSGIAGSSIVKLRVDKGEIQVKGPNVMIGYYNDAEKTKETFTDDGWLRTGDLGNLDNKGRLHIKGRLKAMILGPSGENIYPEEIEGLLGSSQLVEESLVYSGKKGELIALVRLSEAAISEAAKTAAGVIEHALEELRIWANRKLAAFSRLSKIEIRYEPFEKTPTMKIKRYLYI
ncbi:MAG: AMP-binding protein [Treponema sp.]|nr:AMP-binding protein [Treponema sp.]